MELPVATAAGRDFKLSIVATSTPRTSPVARQIPSHAPVSATTSSTTTPVGSRTRGAPDDNALCRVRPGGKATDWRTIDGFRGELSRFLKHFDDCFARRKRWEHLQRYVAGQLSKLPRKNAEASADATDVPPRTL